MRSDRERLLDILEAIERIEKYAVRGKEVFATDELVQTWIVHNMQTMGEAASKVTAEFRTRHAGIPWAQIVAMRNVLVHEYFGMDVEEVWAAVERNVPQLKSKILLLLGEIE